ncbi:hypothetical protein GS982_20115 [Rhodococcus hoagii]|nr:hypothetical protein [Prescottella equi]NKZ84509.1 hypothetical protein [Prescottella equi]
MDPDLDIFRARKYTPTEPRHKDRRGNEISAFEFAILGAAGDDYSSVARDGIGDWSVSTDWAGAYGEMFRTTVRRRRDEHPLTVAALTARTTVRTYATEAEAIKGHRDVCKLLRAIEVGPPSEISARVSNVVRQIREQEADQAKAAAAEKERAAELVALQAQAKRDAQIVDQAQALGLLVLSPDGNVLPATKAPAKKKRWWQ